MSDVWTMAEQAAGRSSQEAAQAYGGRMWGREQHMQLQVSPFTLLRALTHGCICGWLPATSSLGTHEAPKRPTARPRASAAATAVKCASAAATTVKCASAAAKLLSSARVLRQPLPSAQVQRQNCCQVRKCCSTR